MSPSFLSPLVRGPSSAPKALRVHTGGPYHPVAAQFQQFANELGDGCRVAFHEGVEVFDHLDDCDLLVLGGLHWTGCAPDKHYWPEGVKPCGYIRPTEAQKTAFVNYVASGRPVLGWHGGIASYDDWPEFGRLIGFRWDWRVTGHSEYREWDVAVEATGHPVLAGVGDYRLYDELYYNVQVTPGLDYSVHAFARYPNDSIRFPMIMTAEGGRIAGAGKTAYLANGHDLRSTSSTTYRRAVINTIQWLLEPHAERSDILMDKV